MTLSPATIETYFAKARTYLISVGEEACELVTALLVMIIVERRYGQQGLGVYAYLSALFFVARYIADWGVASHVARELAALDTNLPKQKAVLEKGHQAIVLGGLTMTLVLLLTAYFDTGHTRIEEKVGGYLIIAAAVPFANLNSFKLSVLQGLGRHIQVAWLRMVRYGALLFGILVLGTLGLAPSFLLLAVLFSDLLLTRLLRSHLSIPPFASAFKHFNRLKPTLVSGQTYLFAGDGLSLLLHVDLFVLGLFVDSWHLGVYAQAAVMVRLFFIFPATCKPIFKQQYTTMANQGRAVQLAALVQRRTRWLFGLHVLMALWVSLYFPTLLNLLFVTHDETLQSYQIFLVMVPGLIFYSAFSSREPLLQAIGAARRLRNLTIMVAAINLLLTFNLVPFIGIKGAAVATMVSMLFHFIIFGYYLPGQYRPHKFDYLIGGLAAYLVYALLRDWGTVLVNFWLAPVLLGLLFFFSGFYSLSPVQDMAETQPSQSKE